MKLITREEAVVELKHTNGKCFICELLANGPEFIIEKKGKIIVFLSKYPRFWGQVVIAPLFHEERMSELEGEIWLEMNRAAHRVASVLEEKLSPARVYIASTGSALNLPMTCTHIHINVIPVPDANMKPAEVFTWSNGLYSGTEEEWEELYSLLLTEWRK